MTFIIVEPGALPATYCGASVPEGGVCGKKIGADPEERAEEKIIIHQKNSHEDYICVKPFVVPWNYFCFFNFFFVLTIITF